jgi:hypothetical protein
MSRKIRTLLIATLAIGLMVPVVASAADRFTDVPDTNVFHDDISWLADAGVTLGCNPPANDEFCPSDHVTREQMAALMRRFAAYLGAEDGVVNDAAMLDGEDPTAYRSTVSGQAFSEFTAGTFSLPAAVATKIVETTVAAPADGYLMITNTATVNSAAPALATATWVQLNDPVCKGNTKAPGEFVVGTHSYSSAADITDENAHAGSAVVAVTAGNQTLTFCGAAHESGPSRVYSANVMGLWTSEGSASVVASRGPAAVPGSVDQ